MAEGARLNVTLYVHYLSCVTCFYFVNGTAVRVFKLPQQCSLGLCSTGMWSCVSG